MQQFLPEQERARRVLASVDQVGKQTGRSKAQVALAWLRHREVPVIPIIGARKIGQLEDNLESLTLALDQDQVRFLDAASDIQLGFPHDFYRQEMVRGLVYGGLRDKIIT
jgi:aryl-alcohol dehydrogenase-like predicted oxidoreductase